MNTYQITTECEFEEHIDYYGETEEEAVLSFCIGEAIELNCIIFARKLNSTEIHSYNILVLEYPNYKIINI